MALKDSMGVFIQAVENQMKNLEEKKCVDGKSGNYCRTETVHTFASVPEVLTFNLNWVGDPLPGDILKLMVTVPLEFLSNKLVKTKSIQFEDVTYALKGLVCYQNTGHYLAFFRRMLTKAQHLGLDSRI